MIKVLFLAAELRPLAVVGGLGDVIGALPKALKQLGVDVRIAIPKYGVIDTEIYPMQPVVENLAIPFSGKNEPVTVLQTPLPGTDVPVYLIDHKKYLGENGIYFSKDAAPSGSLKEMERFGFFIQSAVRVFAPLEWWPDIIHVHDWHVGLTPVLLKILSQADQRYAAVKSLLTIHNLAYQGWYEPAAILRALGLNETAWPTLTERSGDYGEINSLQQGILNADSLNTVSPTYAKEILTPEYGERLETILAKRKNDLTGILNGIDVERFNPATDTNILATYSADDRTGKTANKADLQKTLGLPVKDIPLIGLVSRLTVQKGIDLVETAMADILASTDIQFVALGTGTSDDEQRMAALARRFPEQVRALIEFNYPLSQKIYAGTDMFLVPSKFEPCGLTQMIAMRYGTVPIVRATGGLADTVVDYDPATGQGNGFVFTSYDAGELAVAIRRAIDVYENNQPAWTTMIDRDMRRDFSWDASAREYVKLYQKLLH